MSNESIYVFIYNPELLFIKKQILSNYYEYFSNFFIIFNDSSIVETLANPIILLPQFLFSIYFMLIFITFYFNFFSTSHKEESTVDSDYLVASITVESEKEITAFDDMVLGFVVVMYIFG